MAPERAARELAVILHADVAGYAAMMDRDEDLTHRRVAECFDHLSGFIQRYGGSVVERRGDAVLARFDRPSDALAAAAMYQKEGAAGTRVGDDGLRPRLRIGLNLGEVIVDRGTLWGPGVNLSQRVEQLAEPGGVCVSAALHDVVTKSLPVDYEDLGEQRVKDARLRVFRARLRPDAAIEPRATSGAAVADASGDRPSLAVLPFENMSGDPEQEFFSDGITEDIITELSRFPTLFVIARHSSFAFKGQNVDVASVGERLRVGYVVEGSVRKAADRLRINAQLVEAATGRQVWAERYDRRIEDLFDVQDDVTRAIVSTLPGQIEKAVAAGAARKRTESLTAYEALLRGNRHFHRFTREELLEARRLYRRAVALDPQFAQAHARIAATFNSLANRSLESEDTWGETMQSVERALALDGDDGWTRLVYAWTLIRGEQFDEAEQQCERSLALNPNDADTVAWIANAYVCLGRADEAFDLISRAIRFNPLHPDIYHSLRGHAAYFGGDFEAARWGLREGGVWDAWRRALSTAACGQLGLASEAREEVAKLVQARRDAHAISGEPSPTQGFERDTRWVTRFYRRETDRALLLDGLRKAGLAV